MAACERERERERERDRERQRESRPGTVVVYTTLKQIYTVVCFFVLLPRGFHTGQASQRGGLQP